MILNTDQLEVIAQMSKGDLGETPYPVLLHALAVHRRSVVLEIERLQLKKQIVFEQGMPVDCHSNLLHETLGRFMVVRGDITEEQCQLFRSKAVTTGQSFAEVLIAEGTVPASELFKILQQNLAKKLLDGFTWSSGEFKIVNDSPPVDSPLRVKTPQLIITGITKLVPDEEIEKAMEVIVDKVLHVNPHPHYPRGELRLTGEHLLLIDLLPGGKLVSDLVAETKKPREKILRLLYALAVIGLVVREDWLPKETVVASPDMDFMLPVPEPVEVTKTDATVVHPEEFRDQIMGLYMSYRKQGAFELFGIDEEASPEVIEQKYLEFSEKFAPWKFFQSGFEDLAEKAREIFIAGGRAFGELSDPEKRNSLVAKRQSKLATRTLEFGRDQFLIKSDLLDSETQFEKGKELLEAKKYKEALQQLQFAHDCDPQNAVYRAELAHCIYLNDPETGGPKALQELNEALRIDPSCGLAAYYGGIIHSDMGNFIEAEAYLTNAVKLMDDEGLPVQALKALKEAKDHPKKKRRFL